MGRSRKEGGPWPAHCPSCLASPFSTAGGGFSSSRFLSVLLLYCVYLFLPSVIQDHYGKFPLRKCGLLVSSKELSWDLVSEGWPPDGMFPLDPRELGLGFPRSCGVRMVTLSREGACPAPLLLLEHMAPPSAGTLSSAMAPTSTSPCHPQVLCPHPLSFSLRSCSSKMLWARPLRGFLGAGPTLRALSCPM